MTGVWVFNLGLVSVCERQRTLHFLLKLLILAYPIMNFISSTNNLVTFKKTTPMIKNATIIHSTIFNLVHVRRKRI